MDDRSHKRPSSSGFSSWPPSCVPASPLETPGAVLSAREIQEILSWERILGLGEVMNFPGVLAGDPDLWAKLRGGPGPADRWPCSRPFRLGPLGLRSRRPQNRSRVHIPFRGGRKTPGRDAYSHSGRNDGPKPRGFDFPSSPHLLRRLSIFVPMTGSPKPFFPRATWTMFCVRP